MKFPSRRSSIKQGQLQRLHENCPCGEPTTDSDNGIRISQCSAKCGGPDGAGGQPKPLVHTIA